MLLTNLPCMRLPGMLSEDSEFHQLIDVCSIARYGVPTSSGIPVVCMGDCGDWCGPFPAPPLLSLAWDAQWGSACSSA